MDSLLAESAVWDAGTRYATQRPGHVGWRYQRTTTGHGSSEGHEMLKRNDKCHSIADDVPIPKM